MKAATNKANQTQWEIRRATDLDLDDVTAFQRSLNRPQRSENILSEYFLAEVKGEIIGCAAVRIREGVGYLYGLAVSKAWRRRGVGFELTQCRLNWLRKNAAFKAFVLTMFWNTRFFKRQGFELADRRLKASLATLHQDFADKWASHSVLLVLNFHE